MIWMSENSGEDEERLLILRFDNKDELRDFFDIWKGSNLGSLVKAGDASNYSNNKEKDKKPTKWSDMGMENYDNKSSEKPSLI